MKTRKMQIGVIGSAADLGYEQSTVEIARSVGVSIAKRNCVLIFGAEKDCDSLSTQAALAARQVGGMTLGVTYDKGLDIFNPDAATAVIATGLVRGGGRELVQSLSCDGLVGIGGGSGTLNELTVAYQANIPVVVMAKTGGWSELLENDYLDRRCRYRYEAFTNTEEAINRLLEMVQLKEEKTL
ncbi:hypothetical protein KBC77_00365 [Candidatus Saccharibacteria bacterium]|nr:hypothetical protein [Candidatus Saccharibacteria bacterium]